MRLYNLCLRDSELARAGVLEQKEIKRLVQEHVRRSHDHGNRLWLLINAELWYRMMILQQSREDLREELTATRSERRTAVGK